MKRSRDVDIKNVSVCMKRIARSCATTRLRPFILMIFQDYHGFLSISQGFLTNSEDFVVLFFVTGGRSVSLRLQHCVCGSIFIFLIELSKQNKKIVFFQCFQPNIMPFMEIRLIFHGLVLLSNRKNVSFHEIWLKTSKKKRKFYFASTVL